MEVPPSLRGTAHLNVASSNSASVLSIVTALIWPSIFGRRAYKSLQKNPPSSLSTRKFTFDVIAFSRASSNDRRFVLVVVSSENS